MYSLNILVTIRLPGIDQDLPITRRSTSYSSNVFERERISLAQLWYVRIDALMLAVQLRASVDKQGCTKSNQQKQLQIESKMPDLFVDIDTGTLEKEAVLLRFFYE